jgi:acetyl esterase/lipase
MKPAAFLTAVVILLSLGPRSHAQDLFLEDYFASRETLDVQYGEAPIRSPSPGMKALLLDLFEPEGLGVPPRLPAFVLVHGGSFLLGDKDRFSSVIPIAPSFTRRGYVVVAINYRKFNDDPSAVPTFDPTGHLGDLQLYAGRDSYPAGFFSDDVAENGQSGEENAAQYVRSVQAAIEDAGAAVAWLRENPGGPQSRQ